MIDNNNNDKKKKNLEILNEEAFIIYIQSKNQSSVIYLQKYLVFCLKRNLTK